MFTILLHSSKTMRQPTLKQSIYQRPVLLSKARELATYMKSLSADQLESSMKLSGPMAAKTYGLWHDWTAESSHQQPAIDTFLGDIYSGLQVQTLGVDDRSYANEHLFILSGLYGVLRACDSIAPYRLEMGYRLPDEPYKNLYTFWGDAIAAALPPHDVVINLSAVEYTKGVLPYLKDQRIISPKFMTVDSKSGQPKFVTVHAKIARGAFAHWLITHRVQEVDDLKLFSDLGYIYDETLSTPSAPVFVCGTFEGLGLSVRLS